MVESDSFADIVLGAQDTNPSGGPLVHEVIVEFVLDLDAAGAKDKLGLVMFDGAEFEDGGFESLHFTIELGAITLVDETFDEVTAAADFFETTLIALEGKNDKGTRNLKLTFDVDSGPLGGGFETSIALKQIPEPSTVLLLALGLAALSVQRRRSSH